jgi:hypothetical protein
MTSIHFSSTLETSMATRLASSLALLSVLFILGCGGDEASGCLNDNDCGLNQVCVNGGCFAESAGCTADSQCTALQTCKNGLCGTHLECANDTECVAPEVCTNSTCGPAPGCVNDSQCTSPLVCINGGCFSAPRTPGDGVSSDSVSLPNAPRVLESWPKDGEANVQLPFTIRVKFGDAESAPLPMKKGSFSTATFTVTDVADNVVDGEFSYNTDFSVVTFTPTVPGLEASPYRVLLNTNIKDTSGTALSAAHTFTFFTELPANLSKYSTLASKFAPALHLELDAASPHFDLPVAANLDGDWDVSNNGDFLSKDAVSVTPTVYWDVIESRTHYFITYGLYWPKSMDSATPTKFVANDTAALQVLVRKSDEIPELVTLLTASRNSSQVTEYDAYSKAGDGTDYLEGGFDGRAEVSEENWVDKTRRINLYVSKGNHSLCAWSTSASGCLPTDANTRVFQASSIAQPVTKKGTVWTYAAETGDQTYALDHTLASLWVRRHETPEEPDTLWESHFDFNTKHTKGEVKAQFGADASLPAKFAVPVAAGEYSGRPFWAWDWKSGKGEGETKGLTRGLSYLDPAWYLAWRHIYKKSDSKVEEVKVDGAETVAFSLHYCFHPYFFIDLRSIPECK